MFDYLLKFNKLPQELRDKVSTPEVMAAITELEETFKLNLASVVMKVMVKELSLDALAASLAADFKLDQAVAQNVVRGLRQRVFSGVLEYLGEKQAEAVKPNQALVKSTEHLPATRIKAHEQAEVEELAEELKDLPSNVLVAASEPPQVKGSSFFFSPDDEAEIRALTLKAVESEELAASNPLEAKLDAIIAEAQMSFSSQLLVDRLRQVLSTYLKGVRSRLDAKLTFAKDVNAGGLNFDDATSEKVLDLADKINSGGEAAKKITPPPRVPVSEDNLGALKNLGARDFEYDLGKELLKAKEQAENEKRNEKNTGLSAAGPVASPAKVKPEQIEVPATPVMAIEKEPPAIASPEPKLEEKPAPEVERLVVRRPIESGNRVRIEDIKAVPRTMGPIDEIRFMDPISFRRLDGDPLKAIQKIKEKIKLLEAERYSQRLEAIKAWRTSPINRLYLKLGEEAIANSKPVDIVIEEKKTAGEPYLNSGEFEAIMNLNKEIRF